MNDISDHPPIYTVLKENLVISKDVPMVSYKKIRTKAKRT